MLACARFFNEQDNGSNIFTWCALGKQTGRVTQMIGCLPWDLEFKKHSGHYFNLNLVTSASTFRLISYPDLTLSLEMWDLVKFDSTPFFIAYLKMVAEMQSTLRLAYFVGHLVKVWFSQAHVLFWINASCAEKSFVFSDAGKAFQLRNIILKICDIRVNGTESPTYPATRIKFCVAGYAVRRN